MIPKRFYNCVQNPNCGVEYIRLPRNAGDTDPYCPQCTSLGRKGWARQMRHARRAKVARLKAQKGNAADDSARAKIEPRAESSTMAGLGDSVNFSSVPEEEFEDLHEIFFHPGPLFHPGRDSHPARDPHPARDRHPAVSFLRTPSGPTACGTHDATPRNDATELDDLELFNLLEDPPYSPSGTDLRAATLFPKVDLLLDRNPRFGVASRAQPAVMCLGCRVLVMRTKMRW